MVKTNGRRGTVGQLHDHSVQHTCDVWLNQRKRSIKRERNAVRAGRGVIGAMNEIQDIIGGGQLWEFGRGDHSLILTDIFI
jgi:hypothetical protein